MKSQIYPIDTLSEPQLRAVAAQIDAGAVVVYPTDTVYGLGTNAFNEASIQRIYQIKDRPAGAALQLLIGTVAQAQSIVQWSGAAEKLARRFWPGALTLILPPNEKGQPLRRGFEGLGLRVPAHPALVRLLAHLKEPLASTSANAHGCPVITDEKELVAFFDGKADIILTGGKLSPTASSVLDLTHEPKLLREAALSRAELEEALAFPIK